MGQVILPSIHGATSLDDVKNTVAIMLKELTWLLDNLDTRNVNELNAEVIVAGSIVADKIAAGAITAEKIEAGAITAEKIDVDELSAITAKMGKLTSGEIYGAYIATKEDAFPRAEMSNTENLFAAYKSALEYIKIESLSAANASPQIEIVSGANGLYLNQFGARSRLYTVGADLDVTVAGNLDFVLYNLINSVKINFVQLLDKNAGTTLYQQLLGKADIDDSGYNLAFDNTTRNLKMFSKSGDLLAQVNIPK